MRQRGIVRRPAALIAAAIMAVTTFLKAWMLWGLVRGAAFTAAGMMLTLLCVAAALFWRKRNEVRWPYGGD
jgi:hypothetical protein